MKLFGARSEDVVPEEELVSLVGGRRPGAAAPAVQLTLSIKGMHCSSCSSAVETALR